MYGMYVLTCVLASGSRRWLEYREDYSLVNISTYRILNDDEKCNLCSLCRKRIFIDREWKAIGWGTLSEGHNEHLFHY